MLSPFMDVAAMSMGHATYLRVSGPNITMETSNTCSEVSTRREDLQQT